jgi:hypothetical protein
LVSELEDDDAAVSAAEEDATSSVLEEDVAALVLEEEDAAVSDAEEAAEEAEAAEVLLLDPPQPASSAAAIEALNKIDTACFFIDYSSFKGLIGSAGHIHKCHADHLFQGAFSKSAHLYISGRTA